MGQVTSAYANQNLRLGQHADYVFGWKGNELQKGMDATGCFGAKCKDMKTQAIDNAKKCSVSKKVQEPLDECKFHARTISSICSMLTLSQGSKPFPVWRCPWFRSFRLRAFASSDNRYGPSDETVFTVVGCGFVS
jgi:hypothetical protein